jgi:hypothetical protein
MSITDKNRKVLWGRSGSLCAFCKTRLVIDASDVNLESVVGDECHIVSGVPNGPRHDPNFGPDTVDSLNNLILLCRVHHKLVDDQPETFSADTVRQVIVNHEKWVHERLAQSEQPEPVRIVRHPSDIPEYLVHISLAKALLDLASDCHSRYDNYPDDLSEPDLDSVGSFLQNLTDWVDLGLNEPFERINAQKSLTENMFELDQVGLRIYAAREKQQLRGGIGAPSSFYALHLQIVRRDDPRQDPLAIRSED